MTLGRQVALALKRAVYNSIGQLPMKNKQNQISPERAS